MTLHIFCISYGVASLSPIKYTNFNDVDRQQNHFDSTSLNEPNESDLPWLKVLFPRRGPLKPNFDNYDFDDYYHGEEELDNSIQYSNENTQDVGSEFDEDEYEEDESLISADKRSRFVPQGKRTDKHVDLCPIHPKRYKIKDDLKQEFELRMNYTERLCNHTKTMSPDYDRRNNRICHALGRTFEYGHGTHCFQRYTSKEIQVKHISSNVHEKYTEPRFPDGCTCGWATYELGPIEDYHYTKILNLCSELKDKV